MRKLLGSLAQASQTARKGVRHRSALRRSAKLWAATKARMWASRAPRSGWWKASAVASSTVRFIRSARPSVADNFAFRFETPGGGVVFSGDTAYNPALADFARGADVLVHEALYEPGVDALVARVPNADTLKKHLMDSHTTTEDVGRVAARASPKLLVLSHFVPGDMPSITDETWLEGVWRHFTGRVVVGRDLMEISLPL